MWSKIKRLSTRLQDTQWMWTMSSLCPLVTQAFSWNKEKSFILKVNFWSHSVACCLAALGRVNASTGWATAALSTGGNIAFTTWAHMINRMNMTIVQICHIMCLFFPPTGVIWWSQKQNEVSPLRKSTCLIYSEMIIQEKQNYIADFNFCDSFWNKNSSAHWKLQVHKWVTIQARDDLSAVFKSHIGYILPDF